MLVAPTIAVVLVALPMVVARLPLVLMLVAPRIDVVVVPVVLPMVVARLPLVLMLVAPAMVVPASELAPLTVSAVLMLTRPELTAIVAVPVVELLLMRRMALSAAEKMRVLDALFCAVVLPLVTPSTGSPPSVPEVPR